MIKHTKIFKSYLDIKNVKIIFFQSQLFDIHKGSIHLFRKIEKKSKLSQNHKLKMLDIMMQFSNL